MLYRNGICPLLTSDEQRQPGEPDAIYWARAAGLHLRIPSPATSAMPTTCTPHGLWAVARILQGGRDGHFGEGPLAAAGVVSRVLLLCPCWLALPPSPLFINFQQRYVPPCLLCLPDPSAGDILQPLCLGIQPSGRLCHGERRQLQLMITRHKSSSSCSYRHQW